VKPEVHRLPWGKALGFTAWAYAFEDGIVAILPKSTEHDFHRMQEDKHLQALNCEVELVSEDAYRGERLQVFYCEKWLCRDVS
jgi:hypothetical protein